MSIFYVQQWIESERGWGTRPDGVSIHHTPQHCRAYIEEYWESLPDEAPDEYSRPVGQCFPLEVSHEVVITGLGNRYYIVPEWLKEKQT